MKKPKAKIVIKPVDLGPLRELGGAIKDIIGAYKDLGEDNLKDEETFLNKTKFELITINNSNKTNLEKLNELIQYKHDLEKLKLQTKIGQEKNSAEKAIITLINPEIARLTELMRIDKEFGVVEKKTDSVNSNESVINPALIQINADLQPNIVYVKIEPARLTSVEIIDYFTSLIKIKNPVNNKPFMSEKDLDVLLARVIPGHNGDTKNGYYIRLNLERRQKGLLMEFIYLLYQKNEAIYTGTKQKYADLLEQNFEIFKGDKNIYKNMVARQTKGINPLLPK